MRPTSEFEGLALHETPDNGRPVIWIHGYTLDSTLWADLWSALPGWHHVGVDLAGHGRSRALRDEDTLQEFGRTVGRLSLSLGTSHLVGMSFGAMVALQAVIESPGAFRTLALGSPSLAGGPTDPDAAAKNRQLLAAHRERGQGSWLREMWMRWPPDIFKGASRQPALWDALARVVDRHSWSELEGNRMDRVARTTQLPHLGAVSCPTLVLVGDDDMPAFKRTAQLIHRGVRHCTRVYLPSTGHLGLLESVAAVAPLLSDHWSPNR